MSNSLPIISSACAPEETPHLLGQLSPNGTYG